MDRVTNLLVADGRIAAYDAAGRRGQDDGARRRGQDRRPGPDRHARPPPRAGLRGGRDDRHRHGRRRWPAASPRSPACPTPIRPSTARARSSSSATRPPEAGNCNVFVIACVSKNREGKELAEIGQLVEAGAVAFSDDGAPVYDAELMRRAFEYCLMFDKPVLEPRRGPRADPARRDARGAGVAGAGAARHSRRRRRRDDQPRHRPGRGHRRPAARDARLDASTASRPCAGRSAAACASPPRPRPHHFTLTDECLRTFDSNYKMNPPLRGREHVEAGHRRPGRRHDRRHRHATTPRTPRKRRCRSWTRPPSASWAWRPRWGWSITRLIEPGHLDWPTALAKMTINPARILGIPKGTLADRRRRRRDDHRPRRSAGGRSGRVPLEEHATRPLPAGSCTAGPRR